MYAQAVNNYIAAGWPCVIPVPPVKKHPPPIGFTGADGRDTDMDQVVEWRRTHADWSIALRLPDGVIGIDVDHYTKGAVVKSGGDDIAELEERLGSLPPTWVSSARNEPSGIRFYRVPPGRYRTKLSDSIEIIQRHHRYAVVTPSMHTDTGTAYQWSAPFDGGMSRIDGVSPPGPDDLPELPEAWIAHLREGSTDVGPSAADVESGQTLLNQILTDYLTPCAQVTDAHLTAIHALSTSTSGGRHDTATERVHRLVHLGANGHPGVGGALSDIRERWLELTAGEDRAEEFDRMCLTSARKAASVVGTAPVSMDPCGMLAAFPPPTSATPGVPQHVEPRAVWNIRQAIGVEVFDPPFDLDQNLAEAVLQRTYPVLRYAADAETWIVRESTAWSIGSKNTAGWAVGAVSPLMPTGDPNAEKGSTEQRRAARRARFMTAASAGAIATKINSLVAVNADHPSTLRLSDLDQDPEILWAGGQPWDLRASRDVPTLMTGIDPNMPHMHTASVTPKRIETSHWDAYLATVWPDPEVRQWALRVLSVALTGYPDAVLPILLGDTRLGKSQTVGLIVKLLGSYAHTADRRLLNSGDNAHASIVYDLKGRRLSFIDEAPREGRWAQERLKQLTGGTPLTGNPMRSNPVTFNPTHTLILTANPESTPLLTDPAIRARIRLIPCEGDPDAVKRARRALGPVGGRVWQREAPGVLATLMSEAAAWLEDPDSAATEAAPGDIAGIPTALADEQDHVKMWVDNDTEFCAEGSQALTLYDLFVEWCRRKALTPVPSIQLWGRRLTKLGYPVLHTRGGSKRPLKHRQLGWFLAPVTPPPPQEAPTPLDPEVDTVYTSGGKVTEGLLSDTDSVLTGKNNSDVTVTDSYFSGDVRDISLTVRDMRMQTVTPFTPRSEPLFEGSVRDVRVLVEAIPILKTTTKYIEGIGSTYPSPSHPSQASEIPESNSSVIDTDSDVLFLPIRLDHGGEPVSISYEEADAALQVIVRRGTLAVDVEASGYPIGHVHYRLKTVQLGDFATSIVLDPSIHEQYEIIQMALERAPRLLAHSASVDLVALAVAGLVDYEQAWLKTDDTAVRAKLNAPQDEEAGLKGLSEKVLGPHAVTPDADKARSALFKASKWLTKVKLDTPVIRSGWAQVDPGHRVMAKYAAADVLDTASLDLALPPISPDLASRERTVQRMTGRVSLRGIRIDQQQVTNLWSEHTGKQKDFAEALNGAGITNPGSSKQVASRLVELGVVLPHTEPSTRYPEGQPSVAAGVLEDLHREADRWQPAVRPVLQQLLAYRHHSTALSLFLEPYTLLLRHGDGRARPTVYTMAAATGRMSMTRPNLQQLPREGGFRACFTADPGYLLVSADFSGVELRVAAALSQDPYLLQLLRDGRDLHWEIAREVFGPDATKADRYMAKRVVFGRLYGGGVKTLAQQAGASQAIVGSAIDVLDAMTPGLSAWSEYIRTQVRAGHCQYPTYSGRTIHLDPHSPHKGPNYVIQGIARELLVDSVLDWERTPWGNSLIIPVHDEIVTMVPEAEAQEASVALVSVMTRGLYGVDIVAEAATPSFAWQDAS